MIFSSEKIIRIILPFPPFPFFPSFFLVNILIIKNMHRIFLIYLNKEKIVEEKNIKDNIAEKLKKKTGF
jgi:hypothetical protein